ncbi:hypothetical protein TRIUR3_07633 [Triticum urartu]|uniref:Uncharacterized protein n=1 Tax=Triticum urartu TaxID=4572 RepID=M7Z7S0_TRIUA|nr:hypothetical protein TRIUR3_07633 [Triticum urartu]
MATSPGPDYGRCYYVGIGYIDAAIDGLNSKTHMKILLKWMWGRRIIKLSCTQAGNTKKFLYSPFTADDAEVAEEPSPAEEQPKKKGWKGKHPKYQTKKQPAAAA